MFSPQLELSQDAWCKGAELCRGGWELEVLRAGSWGGLGGASHTWGQLVGGRRLPASLLLRPQGLFQLQLLCKATCRDGGDLQGGTACC